MRTAVPQYLRHACKCSLCQLIVRFSALPFPNRPAFCGARTMFDVFHVWEQSFPGGMNVIKCCKQLICTDCFFSLQVPAYANPYVHLCPRFRLQKAVDWVQPGC